MFNRNSTFLFATLALLDLTGFENLSGIAHADLSSGLVAYYPFNGNANDASGNGNNGTVNDATLTADRFGNENSAYSFNGVDNYLKIDTSSDFDIGIESSYAVWVNPIRLPVGNRATIINKWINGNEDKRLMLMTDGSIDFYMFNCMSGNVLLSISKIPLNQWTHIVGTYGGNSAKIYLNGVLDTSVQTSSQCNVGDNLGSLYIANHPKRIYEGKQPLNGSVDDIRIYNRALSAAEVQELYLEGATKQLTITKTGTGSGIITSNPAGINCGEDCSENYSTGSNVTLTATPGPVNTWGGWGGDCTGTANTCTVNMDKARNVTAAFNQITPPTATTAAATNVTQTSATLNGTVTSSNATAAVSFDFGTTNTYGTNIAATPAQVYSSTAVAVSTNKTDLTCGTTYHFRTKAVASSGTALGTDQTFTTAACIVNSWLYPVTMNIPRDKLFTLNVTAKSDGMQITNYEFVITFDPTKLSLIYNPVCNNFACPGANALNTNNVYLVGTNAIKIIGLDGQTAANNDLHLLIINFKSKTTLGITNVELKTNSLVNTSGDNIGLASRGAAINITSGICGDANGDTIVNIVDALAIARKLVNLPPPPTVEPLWANVNTDNNVTIIDALHIARYSIGLLLPPEVCAIGQPL